MALSVAFWGWVKKVAWGVSYFDRAASYTSRLRSGQKAAVSAGPESHGRGVAGFIGERKHSLRDGGQRQDHVGWG
jgi:hypothetical protein